MPTVTDFYEWGPWVNGGAWIKTANDKVDFLYKNINQIAKTIENAKNGIWEKHFEQQIPPYGFSSLIFLAETFHNKPLYAPENIIDNLKKDIKQYPQKLKSVIQQSLWSAEFTIWQAKDFDIYCTVGCFTRAIKT